MWNNGPNCVETQRLLIQIVLFKFKLKEKSVTKKLNDSHGTTRFAISLSSVSVGLELAINCANMLQREEVIGRRIITKLKNHQIR